MKTVSKLEREENFLYLRKGIYKEPIAYSKLNGESQTVFFVRSGRGQGYPPSPFLFYTGSPNQCNKARKINTMQKK